jgi:hypothetical protein
VDRVLSASGATPGAQRTGGIPPAEVGSLIPLKCEHTQRSAGEVRAAVD